MEAGGFAYTEVVVIHAPPDMPNGDYMLTLSDVQMPLNHLGMQWIVVNDSSAKSAVAGDKVEVTQVEEAVAKRAAGGQGPNASGR